MATLNTGAILTVLKDRGLPIPDKELLREAIRESDAGLIEALTPAMERITKGVDGAKDIEAAFVLGSALRSEPWTIVTDLCGPPTPASWLSWCMSTPEWKKVLDAAKEGSTSDLEVLTRAFGVLPERQDGGNELVFESLPTAPADARPVTAMGPKERPAGRQMGSFGNPSASKDWPNHHVYAKTGALTIEVDVARAEEGGKRKFTLRLEGAKATGKGSGKKTAKVYDWANKVIFQLTKRELPQAAAVMLGLRDNCKFSAHGENNNKWCEIVAQPGGLFVKVGVETETVAVPIDQENLYEVGLIALRALMMNDPDVSPSAIIEVLRLTARA